MKLTFPPLLLLTALVALPAAAQDLTGGDSKPAYDKRKFSYALGMNLATQLKSNGAEVDVDAIVKGLHDVFDNKPTELQASDIRPIFLAAQSFNATQKYTKAHAEGDAFMTKNARLPGVASLPDGAQYNMVKEGDGPSPSGTNIVVLNYRGTWTDGTEFTKAEKLIIPEQMCPKIWQEILPMMKLGGKCQLVVPGTIAYKGVNERVPGYGSTIVYDLELVAIQPPDSFAGTHFGGARMGHAPDEEFLPKTPRGTP